MAYRNLAKECHPDYLGVEGHNICVLLNEVRYCSNTSRDFSITKIFNRKYSQIHSAKIA